MKGDGSMNGKRRLQVFYTALVLLIIVITGDYQPLLSERDCGCSYEKLINRIKNKWKGDRGLSTRLNKLGMAKHREKDYCGAIGTWCRAAETDPSFWKPFFNIACAHSLMGNPGLSMKFVKRSITSDSISTLRSFISDSDLKPIRNHPGYRKLLNEYGGNECIKTFVKLNSSLKKGDYRLFRSLIHREQGLKIQQKKFSYETFDEAKFQFIRKDMYEGGPLSIEKKSGSDGLISAIVVTKYFRDPPGSPMRCEGWQDNSFNLKKIHGKWYLHSISAEGNGGC
jgi:hypothetical protein